MATYKLEWTTVTNEDDDGPKREITYPKDGQGHAIIIITCRS